jgi:quinol monooxygenase YgiN
MSEPIVFISHGKVKEGKLEDFRELWRETVPLIGAEKPGTLVYEAYVNEEGTELTIVHVLANADAMDELMEGAAERAEGAYEFIESDGFEIYGTPSDGVLGMMKQIAGSGVGLSLNPENIGGYVRVESG